MKHRILPLLLACCLLLSLLPVSAGAAKTAAGSVSLKTEADAAGGRFSGVALLKDGRLLVSDAFHKVLWAFDGKKAERYAGVVPVADLSGEPQGVYHDGKLNTAYFMEPWAVVPFLDGYAVSDAAANVIRYVAGNNVYTLAGTGSAGYGNGDSKSASFDRPTGLAVDDKGNLYVADTGNNAIRMIDKRGVVSTAITGLTAPMGVAWHKGALYVAETGRSRILRVENGSYEVLAGVSVPAEDPGVYYGGFADGPADTAEFDSPEGLTLAEDGTVYIADTGNAAVRMLKNGRVYTLARSGEDLAAPVMPRGLLLSKGKLYVADSFYGSLLTLNPNGPEFQDVDDGAWFAEAAEEAGRRGLIYGTSDTAFSGRATLTRAMFVTILSRVQRSIDGAVVIDGDAKFTDVPDTGWYAGAARWAADLKITSGVGGGRFDPNSSITREQAAVMLYSYAKAAGLDVTLQNPDGLRTFRDTEEISAWAEDAVRWAVDRGLLVGDKGLLNPTGSATRAQAASIVLRFMNLLEE